MTEPLLLEDPTLLTLPKRKTRSLTVNAEEVVKSVLTRLQADLDDRSSWLEDQLRRYAKYRGWCEAKTWQFEDASHAHIPITMYSCLRVQDALCNAVLSQRPAMQSKAIQKHNAPKQKRIDHLLDHEFHDEEAWVEQDAQGILDDEEDEDEEDDDLDYLDQIDQEDD